MPFWQNVAEISVQVAGMMSVFCAGSALLCLLAGYDWTAGVTFGIFALIFSAFQYDLAKTLAEEKHEREQRGSDPQDGTPA